MNIKLANAEGRPTILGWVVIASILPLLVPYGIVLDFKLDKWKYDYEMFEFAKRLAESECFDKLNVHDQLTVVDMELKHTDGYLKWKKVLNPPNRFYWGFHNAAKYARHII